MHLCMHLCDFFSVPPFCLTLQCLSSVCGHAVVTPKTTATAAQDANGKPPTIRFAFLVLWERQWPLLPSDISEHENCAIFAVNTIAAFDLGKRGGSSTTCMQPMHKQQKETKADSGWRH
mmetsp:Transcript_57331/g.134968  ORF Transcript_57331/g.134968 Transcript_57331/m.134968 type:complete len:119 (-) Transcript_57331:98-454(-)